MSKNNANTDTYTLREVSKKLRLSKQTLYSYVKAGKLKVITLTLGKRKLYRFNRQLVDKAILENNFDLLINE